MKKRILFVLAVTFLGSMGLNAQEVSLNALQTNYLEAPLGINNPQPRLFWQMQDYRQCAKQTYYRVLVDTNSLAVVNGKACN